MSVGVSHLYVHVPYCAKLCYYCDFHFSLNQKTRKEYVAALCHEIRLQKAWAGSLQTIYFGGGTPSLLLADELQQIFDTIHEVFSVQPSAEISFECNPDDISDEYCKMLLSLGINRLSIGIQSFFNDDLQLLNRRHSAETAVNAVKIAQNAGFQNITIDLMYGLPNMTVQRWKQNLEIVEQLNIQHLSAYSLMVEEHTALHKFVRTGKFILPTEESVLEQFNFLMDWCKTSGFEQYEISNFARGGMYSQHNSSYWTGEPYLGVGASAHSFDGSHRFWNIAHNAKYIESIQRGEIPCEIEELSLVDRFNELIMTRLRTAKGVDIAFIKNNFPREFYHTFVQQQNVFEQQNLVSETAGFLHLTRKGIMLSDKIMSDFFILE